jgi:hypothetical protein
MIFPLLLTTAGRLESWIASLEYPGPQGSLKVYSLLTSLNVQLLTLYPIRVNGCDTLHPLFSHGCSRRLLPTSICTPFLIPESRKKAIVPTSTRVDRRGIPRWCCDGDRNNLHRASACEAGTFLFWASRDRPLPSARPSLRTPYEYLRTPYGISPMNSYKPMLSVPTRAMVPQWTRAPAGYSQ